MKKDRGGESKRIVETALALGFSLKSALAAALAAAFPKDSSDDRSALQAFAARHGLPMNAVSMCLSYYGQREYSRIRKALAEDLRVDRQWLGDLIESQAEVSTATATT